MRFVRLPPLAAAVLLAASAAASVRFPQPPPDPGFVTDEAGMLGADDVAAINEQIGRLLDDLHLPIVVVTVRSMDEYGAGGLSIEDYARRLFDHYRIGRANWNYGILLLVAERERRARIELGAEWGRDADPVCRRIMDDLIIASFRQGEFAGGIRLGVDGLDAMCRGAALPEPPAHGPPPSPASRFRSPGRWLVFALVIAAVFALRFLDRIVWFVVWALTLGHVNLYIPALGLRGWGSRHHHRGRYVGGGFGGGGGFSGGGGATGSW